MDTIYKNIDVKVHQVKRYQNKLSITGITSSHALKI